MEEAIKYFEEEIYQFKIALNGIMMPDYRTYLENKMAHYELAIKAIKEMTKECGKT